MDYIYAELDPSLLPITEDILFYGTTDIVPDESLFGNLTWMQIPAGMTQGGITLFFKTSRYGQYEVFAYPKEYNPLKTIISTDVGINAIGAWTVKEVLYNDIEYYIYYTKLKQYDDTVDLNFTFIHKEGE